MNVLWLPVLFLLHISAVFSEEELQFVSVVIRHGARSPVVSYPTDKYQEDFWPQGFGQLSLKGMMEEYHLGTVFKSRYLDTGFMDSGYNRSQIYVRSTDFDRTLMSAECVLAGMYPPKENQMFDPDLKWQPIPVHTTPQKDDILLNVASCPVYDKLMDEDNDTYKQIQNANQELFDNLTEWTGEDINVDTVGLLKDTLFVEYHDNNLTMPEWFSPQLLTKLESIDDSLLRLMFSTKRKRKLTGGVWTNQVLKDMQNKVIGVMPDMKMVLYSAHDTTVATMLSVFDMFNGKQPPYSAAFAVELYSSGSSKNDFFVRFYYHNETDSKDFVELTHPNCSKDCPLEKLKQIMAPDRLTEKEWSSSCSTTTAPTSSPTSAPSNNNIEMWLVIALCITSGILILLILILLAFMAKLCCCGRKKRMYVALNNQDTEAT